MRIQKKLVLAGAVVTSLTIGGVAYATFTSRGSGSGTARVKSLDNVNIALAEGFQFVAGSPVDIPVTLTNPNAVSATIGNIRFAVTVPADLAGTCPFRFADTLDGNHLVTRNGTASVAKIGTVELVENSAPQDVCLTTPFSYELTADAAS